MTLCVMMRNQTKYAREWMEFHRMLGVDKFVVYDHKSEDDLYGFLKPYIDSGLVEYIVWPKQMDDPVLESQREWTSYTNWQLFRCDKDAYRDELDRCIYGDPERLHAHCDCQRAAVQDCIGRYKHKSEWIAHFDVDEFMYPTPCGVRDEDGNQKLRKVTFGEALAVHGDKVGFHVQGYVFGTGNNTDPIPNGALITETHLLRGPRRSKPWARTGFEADNSARKSIANPRMTGCSRLHDFTYPGFFPNSMSLDLESDVMRLHHYQFRSVKESIKKGVVNTNPKVGFDNRRDAFLSRVHDDRISFFLPELKARLRKLQREPPKNEQLPMCDSSKS
eukprot:CAMPEP_0184671320 /NCGR_PEP_ID=MMETSP0308-20130426/85426_1 /TAXON_ID=38269 /ORGANISM="Gloeochaete witrockiana, Strain SAG 46.84" /LENGTH=332 /DNA_ID=CAMNT_0027118417 /DNA_START=281 /DNA_END=1279 /DNA_ORIENTATION=-